MIRLVPGFLGRADDFDALTAGLGADGFQDVRALELFTADRDSGLCGGSPQPATGWPDLPDFGERLSVRMARPHRRPLLIGYSLGGRLALHALLAAPALWRGAVIVSAHTGLAGAAERAARCAADEVWATRFETEPWPGLMDAWHAQPVFGGRHRVTERRESDFDRSALAAALRRWSLGTQQNLLSRLPALRFPVLWLAGAEDEKFVRVAHEAVAALPAGELRVVAGVAHRVPWEAPDTFREHCREFLSRLED